jgi:hypothetical protein
MHEDIRVREVQSLFRMKQEKYDVVVEVEDTDLGIFKEDLPNCINSRLFLKC